MRLPEAKLICTHAILLTLIRNTDNTDNLISNLIPFIVPN